MLRYVITDRTLFAPERFAEEAKRQTGLVERCLLLAGQHVDYIQLREKDLSEADLRSLAARLLTGLHQVHVHTRLLINADPRIALFIGADGVHLTSSSAETPASVRKLFREAGRPDPVVSVSCHTMPEVGRARESGATLILFSPVFGKSVQGEFVQPANGLAALAEVCRAAGPVPVLALGGVTKENAPACLAAGAAGIAGIRLFMQTVVP